MAGSRVHQHGSIIKRVQGLLKSEALAWKDRPIWYDVVERFPPKVEPKIERPVPNVHVRKILYPEDYVRAKIHQVYEINDLANLRTRKAHKTQTQLFVEEYIKRQRPGATVDEILEECEREFASQGRLALRKKQEQKKVFEVETTEEVKYESETYVEQKRTDDV